MSTWYKVGRWDDKIQEFEVVKDTQARVTFKGADYQGNERIRTENKVSPNTTTGSTPRTPSSTTCWSVQKSRATEPRQTLRKPRSGWRS